MQFPSSDPTWIVELIKFFVLIGIGSILFSQWFRSTRRFYTDFPFLMSISVIIIAIGELTDVFVNSGLGVYTLQLYKVRVGLVITAMLPMLYMTVLIWLSDQMRAGKIFMTIFAIFCLSVLASLPTIDLTRLVGVLFLLVVIIPFIITFSWAWFLKRLPDIHSGLVVLGIIFLLSGQLFKAIGGILGLYSWLWFAEVLDLIGFAVVVVGFMVKPGWAKQAQISSHPLPMD
ncbi:MAG: hypothetical protein Q6364_05265 [Candidatus Hermodarchaeota archaeon]|nr:hypothetical protein [Candidatus Hermodarchaeota archaeon]